MPVATGPSSGDAGERSAEARAELVMGSVFLVARAGQLVFSGLMVLGDRRRYRWRALQGGLFAVSVAESVWLARRIRRNGSYEDPVAIWVDAIVAAIGLAVGNAALGPDGGALWMKNVAIGAALGASATPRTTQGAAAVSVLAGAAGFTGLRAQGRDRHLAGLAVGANDGISWVGQFVAARSYVGSYRERARSLDEARAMTVARAAALAVAVERARQQRVLQEGTVRVLRTIAALDDAARIGALARREVSRLRHTLRNDGRLVTNGAAALEALVEQELADNIRVELVVAELDTDVDEFGLAAVVDAVRVAIDQAQDDPALRSVVVRGRVDGDQLSVTIRDHGVVETSRDDVGIDRYASVRERLAVVGGTLEVWSRHGEGRRVTVRIPVAGSIVEDRSQDAVEGVPGGTVGRGMTGDDDRAVHDGDIDRRFVGFAVGAAQDERGDAGPLLDGYRGLVGDSTQTCGEQRDGGEDPDRSRHRSMLSKTRRLVVGRTTPSRKIVDPHDHGVVPDAVRSAERSLLRGLVGWRLTGWVTGVTALVFGRRRYRSARLADLVILASGVESSWFARRLWRSPRGQDQAAATVDAITTVAALVAGRRMVHPPDRSSFLNWVPWSLGANAVAGQAMGVADPARAAGGAALIAGIYATQGATPMEAAANVAALAMFFAGGRISMDQLRRAGWRVHAATSEAQRQGAWLAAERERVVHRRRLHDSALQTLEAIGSGVVVGIEAMRRRASAEADRLEQEADGPTAAVGTLQEEFATVALHLAVGGFEVVVAPPPNGFAEPAPTARVALRDATREALRNAQKHSGVMLATVRFGRQAERVEVVVEDHGRGFDPTAPRSGFGIAESILARLADVGGSAAIDSAPGTGTIVTLWVPG